MPVLEQLRSEINQSDFSERHIGLQNTNKRLILSYGPKSALRISSKPGLGTVIKKNLPYQVNGRFFYSNAYSGKPASFRSVPTSSEAVQA
jgi:hypothetical protein